MSLIAILLICVTAFTHSGWNLLCKSKNPSAAFFVIVAVCSIAVLSPFYFLGWNAIVNLPAFIWLALAATGFIQAVYYACLGNAYRLSEISIAYPITRSLPVLIIPLVIRSLHLGEELGYPACLGMILIFAGCIFLPLPRFRQLLHLKDYVNIGLLFVVIAAFCTVGYTVIDNEAMKRLNDSGLVASQYITGPLYLALTMLFIFLFLTPYVLCCRPEREKLREILRHSWKTPFCAGLMTSFDYSLILTAMSLVPNVSYVAAFRQLSIPVGAVLGIILFAERRDPPKLVGLLLIVSGLVLVAVDK